MQLASSLLLLSLLLASQTGWAGTLSQIGSSRWVTVAKVYDGDTFKTRDGEKVRLLGINTPEVAHTSKPGEPLGKRAKNRLKKLIHGKLVRLEFDQEKRDRYGRLLAHIRLRDGRWINSQMIQDGLAHLYIFAPNFRHADKLLKFENEARLKRSGIWGNSRFRVADSAKVTPAMIGQFRLVKGAVTSIDKNGWKFNMGKLSITVPRAHRQWFKSAPKLKSGQQVVVRGRIRNSQKERLFLALHSPFDLEMIE